MAEEKQYWRSIVTKSLRAVDSNPEKDHTEKLKNYLKYGQTDLLDRQILKMNEDRKPIPITYKIEIKHSNTVVFQNSGSMADVTYTTFLCCEDEEYSEKD